VSREEVPLLPLNPQKVLKYYINELTDYEKAEVLDYDVVYFLGKSKKNKADQKERTLPDEKKEAEKQDSSPCKSENEAAEKEEKVYNHNYGYDDASGDYKIVVGDHVGYRYEIVEFLGAGSFGTAVSCIDHKTKQTVAVKIVKNKKKYYYQASVELKILQYLRQHDVDDIMNVIHIHDYVIFRKHLCMSFELLSMNLFEFLKINDFNGFDHNLVRRFAIQLLYALKYLKQLEIIHCDLKPENILLKEENKSGIKIIDFGSSTFIDEKVYTYI
jgi:dual specificity tyrosine-phosphorylation-regulated kinase 2/3/4